LLVHDPAFSALCLRNMGRTAGHIKRRYVKSG
jgi:hypothetical protein